MVRIAHEQLTGLVDADGWIGVTVRPEDGYRVNYRPQPQVEISQSSQDRLMDALCVYCDARDINWFVTTLEYDDDRADQYVWGVQGISTTRELFTPLRDQFIVKREQVDLFLYEMIPRFEDGVHHEKERFLEEMHYIDRFNAYKGGSRGKYTLDYFEDLWEMEYTPK